MRHGRHHRRGRGGAVPVRLQLPAGNEDTSDVTGLDTDENGPNTVTNVIVGTVGSSLSSFTGNHGPVGLFLPAGPGRYAGPDDRRRQPDLAGHTAVCRRRSLRQAYLRRKPRVVDAVHGGRHHSDGHRDRRLNKTLLRRGVQWQAGAPTRPSHRAGPVFRDRPSTLQVLLAHYRRIGSG